jgi:predicted nucleic acid-binding protein
VIDAIIDTNIAVDILLKYQPAVNWFMSLSNQQLAITPTTWFETVRGARNKFELARIVEFLRQFNVEHPTITDNNWAMLQYSQLYLSHGVDWEDCMIASVAVRLAVPLYTRNTKHFTLLPDLDLRQPY